MRSKYKKPNRPPQERLGMTDLEAAEELLRFVHLAVSDHELGKELLVLGQRSGSNSGGEKCEFD